MTTQLSFAVSTTHAPPGGCFVVHADLPPRVRLRSVTATLSRVEFASGRYTTSSRAAKVRVYVDPGVPTCALQLSVPRDAVESFASPHGSVHWLITVEGRPRPWRRLRSSRRVFVGARPEDGPVDDPVDEPAVVGATEPTPEPQSAASADRPMPPRWLWGLMGAGFLMLAGSVAIELGVTDRRTPPPLIALNLVGELVFIGMLYQAVSQLDFLHWLRDRPRWFWRITLLLAAGLSLTVGVWCRSWCLGTPAFVLLLGLFGSRLRQSPASPAPRPSSPPLSSSP